MHHAERTPLPCACPAPCAGLIEAATGSLGGASTAAAALVSAAAFLGQMYLQRTVASQDAKQAAELESMRADMQQGLSEFQANAAVANRRRMKARGRACTRAHTSHAVPHSHARVCVCARASFRCARRWSRWRT
jgi:hypothetical protein